MINLTKTKFHSKSGITLIALVITIIVLLVLAGVSISFITGDNGVIQEANMAKEKTNEKSDEELVEISNLGADIVDRTDNDRDSKITEYWNTELAKYDDVTVNGEKFSSDNKITSTDDKISINGDKYKFDTDGKLNKIDKAEVGETSQGNSTTVNGDYNGANNPIIPKGFKAVDTDRAKWTKEDGYKYGLVIEDVTAGDSTTKGSQFVWVPVENYDEFVLKEGWFAGNSQNYLINEGQDMIAKEAGSSLTSESPNNNATFGTAESVAMYKSVKINKGFYIARYEAGCEGDKSIQDGTQKPVSKANVNVWSDIPWGGSENQNKASDKLAGDDNANGAVKVARAMYNTSSTNVASTLCYDVQWDSVIRILEKSEEYKDYIKNSNGKGNYTTDVIKTGSNQDYSMNNIFDMAGNVYEWTMSSTGSKNKNAYHRRIMRGGSINRSGSLDGERKPISMRTDTTPETSTYILGFRVSLYIK